MIATMRSGPGYATCAAVLRRPAPAVARVGAGLRTARRLARCAARRLGRRTALAEERCRTGRRAAVRRAMGRPRDLLHAGPTREPFQPLPPALLRVHRQLKAQLDPHAIFNPGRLYADFDANPIPTRRCKPISAKQARPSPGPTKRKRSCARACTAASATRPARPTRCSATSRRAARAHLPDQAAARGEPCGERTQQHLDRCLTCRNCETTCPSGVRYHTLLDIGRAEAEKRVQRPASERLLRAGCGMSCRARRRSPRC